jgi:microcin C transport system substrate-binding protein
MRFVGRFFVTLFVLWIASFHAYANDTDYGLAMHGAPQLSLGKHFQYVDPAAIKGSTLRQAAIGSFDTLNPFTIKGKAAQGLNLVYDRLMIRSWDEPFTLYPLIAETVEVADDRSRITFNLNPKATFNDGTKITTQDVKFSFETLREKGRPNMRQVYKLVRDVVVDDDHRITFILGDGYNRETVMILAMMPVLNYQWWAGRTFDETLLQPPISSGLYIIESVEAGRHIALKRNENYWAKDLPIIKGLYNFDRLIFDYFRDDNVALQALKAGKLDVRTEFDPGRWVTAYDDARASLKKIQIPHGRVERAWGFIFNTQRTPFDDIHVRKALSLMIDLPWINTNVFHGQYQKTTSFFANSTLAASDKPSALELKLLTPFKNSLPPEVFGNAWQPPQGGSPAALRANQKKADELLKNTGWIIRDGVRVNEKTHQPLRFEILVGAPDDEKVALSFRRALARLGIEVNIRSVDSTSFRDRLMDYDYDVVLHFWQNSLSPGTEQALYWSCASANEKGRFNYARFCNEAVDKITQSLPNVTTREDLITHTRALDRILTWSHIMVPLFYAGRDSIAYNPSIQPPPRTALYGNVMEAWAPTRSEAR